MHRANILCARFGESGLDLEEAARVGGHHDSGAGPEDILDLASLQTFRHVRFGQVVAAGAPATNIGFGQFDERVADGCLDQLAGFPSDPLGMREVACIVVGHTAGTRGIARTAGGFCDGFFQDEEFGQVHHVSAELLGAGGPGGIVGEQVTVFFECGAATRGVNNDPIEMVLFEDRDIAAGAFPGLFEIPSVRMKRPATALVSGG